MKVVVTGASGFIGREVTKLLSLRGFEVHALSRRTADVPQVSWHRVDLFENASTDALISEIKPSHLIHLAWTTEPGKFWNAPENHQWEQASKQLYDSFARNGGARFVGAGSCAEYEWNEKPCLESEPDAVPSTLYGRTKLSTWNYVNSRGRENGISTAWGRIFWLYGPHEHPNRLVPHVINRILRNAHVDCSSGEQIRDFMHVSDVAEVFVKLLESDFDSALNVASGKPVPVRDIVEHIAERMSAKELIRFGVLQSGGLEPARVCADTTKLRTKLAFTPLISLTDGLDSTISWWQSKVNSRAGSM